jgi:hypothetical protein
MADRVNLATELPSDRVSYKWSEEQSTIKMRKKETIRKQEIITCEKSGVLISIYAPYI